MATPTTSAYADLVSGSSFHTRDLVNGRLTVFVQVPLKTLQATPALGRVIVGALLNAAYEADGRVRGRILFLLDEVARLGYLEQARYAGRNYGITLLLLYQSLGQLVGQWGREGKQAWYDATSWRLFAAVQDPDTTRELSAICGEYAVVATAEGNSAGSQGRGNASLVGCCSSAMPAIFFWSALSRSVAAVARRVRCAGADAQDTAPWLDALGVTRCDIRAGPLVAVIRPSDARAGRHDRTDWRQTGDRQAGGCAAGRA
jgi:hypothetical protein